MSAIRPTVSVLSAEDASIKAQVPMPKVFESALRPDLVCFVADQMRLNSRQAYAVSTNAGYQTAAESWGTGRAVARIPRVPGGGTHRAGQAAFGNMCRGGGMFNPTKIWRRWHRKINVTQKRHAAAAAVSATAIPALVMARGHRIDEVPEMPIVVSSGAEKMEKTKDAIAMLKRMGLGADLTKVTDSKKVRCGKGKARNRRYVMRKGPLVVYAEDNGLSRACRNIPGVDTCKVDRLNLLQLAPGGHFGRATVYTEGAFKQLQQVFGSQSKLAQQKGGYKVHRAVMTNPDLNRIINSDEIQTVLRPMRMPIAKRMHKKNALNNKNLMAKLNPGSGHLRFKRRQAMTEGTNERAIVLKKQAKTAEKRKSMKSASRKWFKAQMAAYTPKSAAESASVADEE